MGREGEGPWYGFQSPSVHHNQVLTPAIAQSLASEFPDYQIPLYIAFLAYDEFAATHDKDALGGAPKVPGETDPDTDAEKVKGIALKIIDDLIKEASEFIEDPEYSEVKSRAGDYVQEL